MTLTYEPMSHTLYIDAREPYEEQESDEIALGVIARTNPETGEVESLEVMHFQTRFERGEAFESLSVLICERRVLRNRQSHLGTVSGEERRC